MAASKALTTASSLKAGSLWISKKAKEELSNVTIDSITSTVEGKAKWVFNKLKGKTQKDLPDLLREYNLPAGLFPDNIIGYEFSESEKKLVVHVGSTPCEVTFRDGSVLRYANRVKATLSKGKLVAVEGVKTKVIVWVKVSSVSVESFRSDKLWFFAATGAVKKCRLKDVYDLPRPSVRVDAF